MKIEVKIDDSNVIEVFDLDNPTETGAPFMRQDIHPDGRNWIDKNEAQTWIDNFLTEWLAARGE